MQQPQTPYHPMHQLIYPLSLQEKAMQLATAFNLQACLDSKTPEPKDTHLCLDNQGLALVDGQNSTLEPLRLDFCDQKSRQRLQSLGRSQPLAKAVGLKSKQSLSVIDTTCGLAADASALAYLGAEVIGIEQHPMVCALTAEALECASADPNIDWPSRLELHFANSIEFLSTIKQVDVIYIDTMFPTRSKSALVKKPMQILHRLIGPQGPEAIFSAAENCDSKKIVIKGPLKGPKRGKTPTYQVKTKTTRFDVYQR